MTIYNMYIGEDYNVYLARFATLEHAYSAACRMMKELGFDLVGMQDMPFGWYEYLFSNGYENREILIMAEEVNM